MDNQSNLLEKSLLELLDPNTTPEKALRLLLTTCYSPEKYRKGDEEPVVIFLAFIRFIMERLPNACVDGIWLDIFRKTVMYSRNFSSSMNEITRMRRIYVPGIYKRVIPVDDFVVSSWIEKALSTQNKCPNPYIRLELFRLLRVFREEWQYKFGMSRQLRSDLYWKPLCKTFMHTISEIQPQHLYQNGGLNKLLFGVLDLEFILQAINVNPDCLTIIYDVLSKNLNFKEVFMSEEAKFLTHCIQFVGAFAVMTSSCHEPKKQTMEIVSCFLIFKEIEDFLSFEDPLPGNSIWRNFSLFLSHTPFRNTVVKTIRELSAAIINIKRRDVRLSLLYLRDTIAGALEGVCTNTDDFPRLLLSRQVQGPTIVHQHSLLLQNLDPDCKKRNTSEINFASDVDWLEIFLEKHVYDLFTNSDSDSDNDSDSSNVTGAVASSPSVPSYGEDSLDDSSDVSSSMPESSQESEENDY